MKRGSGGESAALKGLVGYDDDDDDDSPSSSPSMQKEDEGDDNNNTSSLDLPLYKLVNDTRPPQRKKRKTVRWADAGMLEEVFLFYENRPVDKEAKLPPDDEEVEEGEEKAVPPPPPSPSSPKLSGLYQPLETVTTVRKAASTLPTTESHLAPGGKEKWVASGSSSWWGGPRVVVEREGMAKASVNPHSQHHLGLQDGPYDPNLFEFFCDQCQYTIDKQEIRYECAECPSEFCLCEECYDEMGSTHPHPCILNRLPFHITLMDKTTVAT